MDVGSGIALLTIGLVFIVFGRRMARARIALHYPSEDLRATSGPRRRRIRRNTVIATVLNIAMGVWFVYGGVRVLFGR